MPIEAKRDARRATRDTRHAAFRRIRISAINGFLAVSGNAYPFGRLTKGRSVYPARFRCASESRVSNSEEEPGEESFREEGCCSRASGTAASRISHADATRARAGDSDLVSRFISRDNAAEQRF